MCVFFYRAITGLPPAQIFRSDVFFLKDNNQSKTVPPRWRRFFFVTFDTATPTPEIESTEVAETALPLMIPLSCIPLHFHLQLSPFRRTYLAASRLTTNQQVIYSCLLFSLIHDPAISSFPASNCCLSLAIQKLFSQLSSPAAAPSTVGPAGRCIGRDLVRCNIMCFFSVM